MVTQHLILAAAFLLASAHAQYDFCKNTYPHHLRNDVGVREEVVTRFFEVGDKHLPRLADSVHDLVEGNCTGDLGEPFWSSAECYEPNPDGFVESSHGLSLFASDIFTCIKALDRSEDGTGGFPRIAHGGVGDQYVNLVLTSQKNKGLRFYSEIYAAKANVP